jgi:hypothetical protein
MYAKKPNGINWFAHYLSAFGISKIEKLKKLMTNPSLRILFLNQNLLNEVKTILKTNSDGKEI